MLQVLNTFGFHEYVNWCLYSYQIPYIAWSDRVFVAHCKLRVRGTKTCLDYIGDQIKNILTVGNVHYYE